MIPRATTTVSILRGSTTDDYGDDGDAATPVASGIPASIIEQTRNNRVRADQDPRTVRQCIGRLPPQIEVRTDDRIRDERTGTVYDIVQIRQPANPYRAQPTTLELTRTT